MVITSTSQVDGHAHQQPAVIEGQETHDPDEPPLPGLRDEEKSTIELQSVGTTLNSNSVTDIHDVSTNSGHIWDGSPGTAQAFDGKIVAAVLDTNPETGLTSEEASKRLERDGPNSLDGAGQVSMAKVLLRQVSNSLTIVSIFLLKKACANNIPGATHSYGSIIRDS